MSDFRARSSSPDPLNDLPTLPSPAKQRRRLSRSRHSLPPQRSSPSKQTFQLDLGYQLSPQKIRVTVEAGDSDTENSYYPPSYSDDALASPSTDRKPLNRRRERTTTTTIPLKGLSDGDGEGQTWTPKRGRG